MNLNLIRCAFGKHEYGKAINDDTLNRVIRICKHCGYQKTLPINYLSNLEERKRDIIEYIKADSFIHAKTRLDDLIKNMGY